MYSVSNFEFIHKAGFTETFSCIEKAMQCYDNDPYQCCSLFRQALESSIDDLLTIIGKSYKYCSIEYKIRKIRRIAPRKLYPDSIETEMHNLRKIGNLYSHYRPSSKQKFPQKDRLTCYCAMMNIGKWQIMYAEKYPKHIEKKKNEIKKLQKLQRSWLQ